MKMKSVLGLMLLSVLPLFGDVTLVKDGKPAAVVVLAPDATKSAQLGAYELQHHIRLITGAELPILAAADDTLPRIFVGAGPAVPASGEGAQPTSGERICVQFAGQDIHLFGNDTPDAGKVSYPDHKTFPSAEGQYNGSLFAVYDFLELCCGVGFYWLDETGTTYQPRPTLTVKEVARSHTPPMDAFREIYCFDGERPNVSDRDIALWKLRWRMCQYFGAVNHNMASIYFRHYKPSKIEALRGEFIASRPEYFAQGYEGRSGGRGDWLLNLSYPEDPDVPPQICYSHPGVSDFYAGEVVAYCQGRNYRGGWGNKMGTLPVDKTILPRFKGQPFFYPIEGADNGSFCQCPDCSKKIKPGNISNLKFGLMAEIARKAAKLDPEAGVATLAYIQSLYYPDQVDLPGNIAVELCLTSYAWWHPIAYKLQHGEYKKWIDKEANRRPLTLWTYLFGPQHDAMHFGKYKPFPGLYPWKTADQFKEFAADGIRGWFTEVYLAYNILEAYVAARICYDPAVDTDALIDDYFRRYYGAAGAAIKAFYREIEQAFWNPDNCPPEWLANPDEFVGPVGKKHPFWGTGLHSPELNWKLGTDARMAKLGGLIETAKQQVATPSEKIRLQRLLDSIWEPALAGKREHLELQNLPQKKLSVTIPAVPDAGGDPAAVDWDQAYLSENFTDAAGRPVAKACTVRLALDARHLYIKFNEDAAPTAGKMLWRENIEIYFSASKTYPLYHLAISPFGETAAYKHDMVNDVTALHPYDFGLKQVSNRGDASWELLLAIPLDRLPFDKGSMTANFFRTWGAHGDFASWAPTIVSEYIRGLSRFGTLHKP